MSKSIAPALLALTAVAALAVATLAAPTPPLSLDVQLSALGGFTAKAPDWKAVRTDDAVVVLEQTPDPALRRGFHVLMVAVEEGPPAEAPVPWEKIRDNVVEAASQADRALTLMLGDAFEGAPGFEGRYLSGTFRGANDQQVGLELVALVRDGRLVTVSLVSDALTADTRALLEAVASTVSRGG